MITISKIEMNRSNPSLNEEYKLVELRGLSTDTKPTTIGADKIDNGSTYIEIDTGKVYLFDLEGEEWKEI